MSFWNEFKTSMASWVISNLRPAASLQLPETGRSSIQKLDSKLGGLLSQYDGISPYFDPKNLTLLKYLWMFNSDFSQYVSNVVNLGNSGHQLTVNAKSTSVIESSVARLNESAANLYPHSAGIDGFINQALSDIATYGALSAEDVIDLKGKRVKKIVMVPVEDVRFVYDKETDEFIPHQRVSLLDAVKTNGLLALHPVTYRYYGLLRHGNSPYGKPPALAALESITTMQADALGNVKHVAKKFGLLGIILSSVMQPRQKPTGTETESEYQSRATSYLRNVRDRLEEGMSKGLVAHYQDQKISVEPGAPNGSGFYDVFRVIEEQVMSGMASFPAFHGRTDSTTETFADVVYNILLAQRGNMQRLVKRSLERTYRLDLRLGGVEADGVSISFNKAPARNLLQEMQAEEVKVRTILDKAKNGMISPDRAAQEMGYESAFDANVLTQNPEAAKQLKKLQAPDDGRIIQLTFDKNSQKYIFRPEVISLADSKKKLTEEQIDEILDQFINKYFETVSDDALVALRLSLDRLRDFIRDANAKQFKDADDFAEQITGAIESSYKAGFDSLRARNAVRSATKSIYEFYRLKDATPFEGDSPIKLRFGGADTRSVKFFGELDHFYFSKFANNTQDSLKTFFRKRYLENGAALFGRETSEELADFRAAAGDKLKNLTDRQIKGIVQNSVQRVRNWGHIGSLSQGKLKLARIVAILDARTTDLCKGLDGKIIRVGVAQTAIERLNQLEPGAFAAELYESAIGKAISKEPVATIKKFIEADGKTISDDLVSMGRGFPPYHVNCRTRVQGIIPGASNE